MTFSKKIEKLTFVKEDSIEKPSGLILTPEILHSIYSKECFNNMDNVSILQFSLSQIKSNLICSISVSIKSFTFQQTDLIAQLYISVFDLRFWFSDSSKLAIDSVKSWPSNCFFFVTSSIKSSIGLPIENFLLVVELWKEDPYLGWVKSEIDWKCSEISTFWITSKFKHVFLHKVRTDFFKKDYNQKIYVCKGGFDWKTNNFNPYTRNTTL